jgi:membrane protein DedA with SNARE-associated domain
MQNFRAGHIAILVYRGRHCLQRGWRPEILLFIPQRARSVFNDERANLTLPDPPTEDEPGESTELSLTPEQSRVVKVCLSMIGVLTVAAWTGLAFSPYLMSNYPLALIGMSPASRHMVLVAPIVGPWLVLTVGGARMLLFTAIAFFLGRSIGEPGLIWLDQNSVKISRFVRWLQGVFQRWSYVAIFIYPVGAMASIAGAARMSVAPFFLCAVAGILFRLTVLVLLANSIREPLLEFIDLVRAYQWPATAVCLAVVVVYQLWKRRAKFAKA